jgi:hypothetical protein
MYVIKRNGKTIKSLSKLKLTNYEKARQALRSYIRKAVQSNKLDRSLFVGNKDWDGISRQPVNFTDAGFRIVRT